MEGLVRDSGKPAYFVVSRDPQDEVESFAFKPRDVCERLTESSNAPSVIRYEVVEKDRVWDVLAGYPGEPSPEESPVAKYLSQSCSCCLPASTHGNQRINSVCRIQERSMSQAEWIYEKLLERPELQELRSKDG